MNFVSYFNLMNKEKINNNLEGFSPPELNCWTSWVWWILEYRMLNYYVYQEEGDVLDVDVEGVS